jgi:hypothetical protein
VGETGFFSSIVGPTAYDEAVERTVVFGRLGAVAYDAASDRWELLTADWDCQVGPTHRTGHAMVYDPVNRRLVVVGGTVFRGTDWVAADDVIAFDPATRGWTTLLAPTVRYPACPAPTNPVEPTTGPASDTALSPLVPRTRASLVGGPFFERAYTEPDSRRCGGFVVAAETVVDGRLLPRSRCWDEGAVWWETRVAGSATGAGAVTETWIRVDLPGAYRIDAAIVQADDNDEYRLSYRDLASGAWEPLWEIPAAGGGGMQTRPNPADDAQRKTFANRVVTEALRLEATSGDAMYAVSEIQVFGRPVGD